MSVRVMNKKMFWVCFALGLLVGLSAWAIYHLWIAPPHNPKYSEYNEYREWMKQGNVSLQQRKVEEVIAGVRPHSDLRGSALEGIAEVIHRMNVNTGQMNARQRAEFIRDLFVDPDGNRRIPRWIGDHNKFFGELAVLNDTTRFALLLSGDDKSVLPGLPTAVPEKFKHLAMKDPPPENLPRTSRAWKIGWLVFSAFFALTFFIAGGVVYYDERKDANHHPFASFPDFTLGWIVIIGCLPGFAVGYLLYLMTLSTKPLFSAIRNSRTTFNDEYSGVMAQLEQLKAQAEHLGNQAVIGKIEKTLERIREGQNRQVLNRVKNLLGNLQGQVEGLEDIEQSLRS